MKENNIKDINYYQSKKFIMSFMIVMIAVIICICIFMSCHEMRIKVIDVSEYETETDNIQFKVKKAKIKKRKSEISSVEISGWCVKKGVPTNNIAMHVLLKNSEGIYYILPTYISADQEVTGKINDGINYDNSTFNVSLLNVNKLSAKDKYELFLLYEIEDSSYLVSLDKKIKVKKDK